MCATCDRDRPFVRLGTQSEIKYPTVYVGHLLEDRTSFILAGSLQRCHIPREPPMKISSVSSLLLLLIVCTFAQAQSTIGGRYDGVTFRDRVLLP